MQMVPIIDLKIWTLPDTSGALTLLAAYKPEPRRVIQPQKPPEDGSAWALQIGSRVWTSAGWVSAATERRGK